MKEYKFKINGKDFHVAVNGISGTKADVTVNGVNYDVELENAVAPVQQAAPAQSAPVAPVASAPKAQAAAPAHATGGKAITSPLPGVIISVDVKEGSVVKRGQKVAVIEAMKMENDILADADGTVTAVHVSKGDTVAEDAKIVTIA
ncbi:MAG: biotin/lipoyl-binding protein [Bacteroides sp.]|nr:biotin/lipoyl-binding protein [Bacteroides sp.]MDD7489965.1 biotin/lipoyl-binding protein [Bacteroides sp.]MDY5890888.1 biotin/lipoyl-containing protein [Candidatus Cryptobacteroides sp.]